MASEWQEVNLGAVVEINPTKRDARWQFPYMEYIDISSVGEGFIEEPPARINTENAPSRAQRLIQDGDVVLSTVRPKRRSMFFAKKPSPSTVVSTGFAVIRSRDELIDPRFLYALVFDRAFTDYLVMREQGAAYPAVSPSDIAAARVLLPPISEQRSIARFLGSLEDKIELNRQMSVTLVNMARTLFKSWLVDFDPVRAKAEGRPSNLPSDHDALFPSSFVSSELGEIPEGWSIRPVGELADVVGGSTPSTKESMYWEEGCHWWATPKDLSALQVPVLLATERRITDAGLSQIGSGALPPGTVLLSSRAPIGYLAIAEVPVAINQGFIAMKPKNGVSNLFLLNWAASFHEVILSRANGSTFLEISKASFRPIPVVVPDSSVMAAFEATVRPLYRRLVLATQETRTLIQLRDNLLPKLVSGEIRLPNGEHA